MNGLKDRIIELVGNDLFQIEQALLDNLNPYLPLVSHVGRYILFSGGKRIRPLLMVLSARICGYKGDQDKKLSAIFEYLHAATLLHDDVVDGAEIRRGNPVSHYIWGNPATVLVGDFLLSRSISLATEAGSIKILKILADTTAQMSEGEIEQLLNRDNLDITESDYMEVIKRKTACLIQAACHVGALLAEAPKEQEKAMADYGYNLGIAFQIADDLLDYTARTEVFGKSTGKDLKEGKLTLPLIHALGNANPEDRERMIAIVKDPNTTMAEFEEMVSFIERYGGFSYTKKRAQHFITKAKTSLSIFKASNTRETLSLLADYVLAREL